MATRILHTFPIVLCAALLVPAPLQAQDALTQDAAERRTDLARTLFAQGVEHVAAQRWAEAEASFREALQNHDAPAIRYNLASVLFEQGEYPEASALVTTVLADSTTPEDIRAHATELRGHLDTRAGFARFEVTGAAPEGVAVHVDGYVVPDPSAEVPLAPGAHVASAMREGAELADVELDIAQGEHRTVTLAIPVPGVEEGGAEEAPPPPPAEPPVHEQWWFWTAIGGGVVVVAAVVIGASVASSGGVQEPVVGDFAPGVLRW